MSLTFIFLLLITTAFALPLKTAVREEDGAPTFSYNPDSEIGPDEWGNIQSFETCGTGEAQSPIDLPAEASLHWRVEGPETHMIETNLTFELTTENFELHCEHEGDCGFSVINGKRFDIVNMHFHSPSEHKLGGEQFPLEAHMVHRSEDGELAVISTLFRAAKYLPKVRRGELAGRHEIIEETWRQCEEGKEEISVNMQGFIGERGYVSYAGSLTTPPCTEGVQWFVAQTIPSVSADEITRYFNLTESSSEIGNNRPTQPLHERTLEAFVRN